MVKFESRPFSAKKYHENPTKISVIDQAKLVVPHPLIRASPLPEPGGGLSKKQHPTT
jgi:hypothetical protein